jgi:hypothetical protein
MLGVSGTPRTPFARRGFPTSSLAVNLRLAVRMHEHDERRRRELNPLLRFCRPPPGRQAPAPLAECFDNPSQGNVLARNRTWSSTFAESCARPSHPEDKHGNRYRNRTAREPPTRELNPALRLRRPPCVRHTRGEVTERSALARSRTWSSTFGGSRAVRHTPRAQSNRSRRPDSNQHEPAYKAGALPFGHVGRRQQGCKDLNPVREFWRLAALPGAHPYG